MTTDAQNLTTGRVGSCGCLASDVLKQRNTTHGRTRTKEYRAWAHAKDRCFRKSDPRFAIYGARGITMCPEWKNSFEAFFAFMGACPTGLTLERKDVNKGYNPENCEWASVSTQRNNTRVNIRVTVGGETMTLTQLAEKRGLDYKSLHHFHRTRGLPIESALALATGL